MLRVNLTLTVQKTPWTHYYFQHKINTCSTEKCNKFVSFGGERGMGGSGVGGVGSFLDLLLECAVVVP